jgi:acetyl-CoA acetyltransferase
VTGRRRTRDEGVRIMACARAHTHQHVSVAPSLTSFGAATSSTLAREKAGIEIQDVRYGAIYDSVTITLAILLEEIGLAGRGEAGSLARAGHFEIDGRLPRERGRGCVSLDAVAPTGIER